LWLQVLTKAGVLNVPEWYEAGKVSAEQTGIALGEQQQSIASAGTGSSSSLAAYHLFVMQ
jgi:hypothetical protein